MIPVTVVIRALINAASIQSLAVVLPSPLFPADINEINVTTAAPTAMSSHIDHTKSEALIGTVSLTHHKVA